MTRCCTRAVYNSAIAHTHNLLSKGILYLQMYGLLTKIYVYEKCLVLVDLVSF